MTLQDALTNYTARLHSAAVRPFLGFRIRNADNDLRRVGFSTPSARAQAIPSRPSPTLFQHADHAPALTGETA